MGRQQVLFLLCDPSGVEIIGYERLYLEIFEDGTQVVHVEVSDIGMMDFWKSVSNLLAAKAKGEQVSRL